MSTDGGQPGTPTPGHSLWQKVLSQTVHRDATWRASLATVSPWRLLEGVAVAGVLIWFVLSNGRHDRAPDTGQQQTTVKPPAAVAPAFSDQRALVPGTQAAQTQPQAVAQPPRVAAVQPAQPAPVPQPLPTVTPTPPAPAVVPAPAAPVATAPQTTAPATKAPVTTAPAASSSPQPAASANRLSQMAANIPPPPSAPVAAPTRSNDACPAPDIRIAPLAAGQMQIQVLSPCRQGQDVALSYDTVDLRRVLPTGGAGVYTLDLFAGDRKSVDITFADGTRRVLPVVANDLGRVSKIAVRWRAPVNLDLHVFENGAMAGQPGHVWTQAPASAAAAVEVVKATGRGHGFLNAFDDGPGDKIEVYTYVHGSQDQGTNVAMALDHETRGSLPAAATCGQGALAKIEFGVTMLARSGEVSSAGGIFKPARCDEPLAAAARFDYGLMPVIATRN